MKEKIIEESIISMQKEGLKFSVDTLAEKMKVSKKTIYKYFANKEELSLAIFERCYEKFNDAVSGIINENSPTKLKKLLMVYYKSIHITRKEVFNKYALHEPIYGYTKQKHSGLWTRIIAQFDVEKEDISEIKLIVDGTFLELCNSEMNVENVIERLVKIIC